MRRWGRFCVGVALALSAMDGASASAQDNIRLTPISIADTGYQYAPPR